MGVLRRAAIASSILAQLLAAPAARACPGGLDGTFVQIDDEQLRWGARRWGRALDELGALGVRTVIVQYTGDPYGSYEARYASTLSNVLTAADRRGVSVWLGLAHMPGWPHTVPERFAPLSDPRAVEELGRLCGAHRSCEGFYLSPELDETWRDRVELAHRMIADASRVLRQRVPRARISIAPFFARELGPEAFAVFLADVVRGAGVDVVILQGGTGTGRASAEDARAYLREVSRAMGALGIETWLVVELFDQIAGTPWDEEPFAARPASFEAVRGALLADEPAALRRIAFSVFDYAPADDERGRALRDGYRAWCRARSETIGARAEAGVGVGHVGAQPAPRDPRDPRRPGAGSGERRGHDADRSCQHVRAGRPW